MSGDELREGTAGGTGCSGAGLLVFVVGPSGAGKDTLLSYARQRLAERGDIVFARRRITRASDHTEDHLSLDGDTFERGVAEGRFPLYWRANGLGYALGEDVAAGIANGNVVVANGSRAAVALARHLFARVKVVLVTAPPEVLAARISARGREGGEAAAQRLAREPRIDIPPDLILINDGGVEQAGERLTAFLRGLGAEG
ncbi:phosphonate metabolism protein/1,5-bisphosphokinase (PRPP-forming) PhnN [Ancylobacter sp. G4_0304]|uniref:phosphonate metabolism protein/1,5-bisphosphokinase (PRPP-forming) PhnN n=1 Tax=Ancylobacter sp. G4_0304 TaxID=3114289 RepID=UPI0039C65AD1